MFELQVASRDVTNGNIAISWCVTPETLQYLAANKVKDPQVIIVVAPTENYHSRREYRKVVPLQDLMTYLEFKASGENQIRAFISTKSRKDARGSYLSKEDGDYKTDILSEDGKEWGYIFGGKYQTHTTESGDEEQVYARSPDLPAPTVMVNVPAGVFAKEPAKWEKTWVNHWFRSKPQDQCDFRRRRLLAYTVQPLVMLLDVLVVRTLMLLVSTLWWSRGMSLKYHFHPMTYSIADTVGLWKGGSWVVPTLPEDAQGDADDILLSYVLRKCWGLLFTPPALVGLWAIAHFHVWLYALVIGASVIGIVALAFWLSTGAFMALGEWILNLFMSKDTTPWYLDEEELNNLTCTQNFKARTSVSALPAKHRTIGLRFQDLKAKVCRPFSA